MKKKIILIAGPTAVGKTSLSISIARFFQTEIISSDSRQCFQELSIGVARPTPEEQNSVHHHFISSHSIHEEFTAAAYELFALETVSRIFQQHDTVVMTGGTGLYIKAFSEGLDEIPSVPESLRQQLKQWYTERGMDWLQTELLQKDPLFAAHGEMQNPQRMLRALELVEHTGTSILNYRTKKKKERPFTIIPIGLELPREELYERINQRVNVMIEQGLVEEAKSLYPYRSLNALQTVGYKELFGFFDGKYSLDIAIDKIKKNTRHYAKRQLTWFRKQEGFTWFHPSQAEEIISFIQAKIKKPEEHSGA